MLAANMSTDLCKIFLRLLINFILIVTGQTQVPVKEKTNEMGGGNIQSNIKLMSHTNLSYDKDEGKPKGSEYWQFWILN